MYGEELNFFRRRTALKAFWNILLMKIVSQIELRPVGLSLRQWRVFKKFPNKCGDPTGLFSSGSPDAFIGYVKMNVHVHVQVHVKVHVHVHVHFHPRAV